MPELFTVFHILVSGLLNAYEGQFKYNCKWNRLCAFVLGHEGVWGWSYLGEGIFGIHLM